MSSSMYILGFSVEITRTQDVNKKISYKLVVDTENEIGGTWTSHIPCGKIEQVTSQMKLHIEQQFQKFLDGEIEFYDCDNYDAE